MKGGSIQHVWHTRIHIHAWLQAVRGRVEVQQLGLSRAAPSPSSHSLSPISPRRSGKGSLLANSRYEEVKEQQGLAAGRIQGENVRCWPTQ
eukprot:scaffold239462_cov17-Tisochrysis_lutea.AAC.1